MSNSIEDTIVEYYKDPKKGLSIKSVFRNLLKDGYKVTIKQIETVIKDLEEYHKARVYKEQKNLFLKTVTGRMGTYQADTFSIKLHSKFYVKFVALINVETRRGYVYHVPDIKKKSIVETFNKWISDIPEGQEPTVISSDLGSEFNSKDFYGWLRSKNIRLFYINKSDYKTSYATAIVDRFIRTIKDKLLRFQKLNDSKSIIEVMKEIVEGYNETEHRALGKPPNEMTYEDVQKNAYEKREHNNKILSQAIDSLLDKSVGVLVKKNKLDKGNKIKLDIHTHKVVGLEGYNIVLDNKRSYPPKDIQLLNNK